MPAPSRLPPRRPHRPRPRRLNRRAWRFYLGLAIVAVIGAAAVTVLDPFSYHEILLDRWFGPVRQDMDRIHGDAAPCNLAPDATWALITVAALLWSWLLRRQVAQRTRQLQRELSERQQVEAALRESEARFRDVTEAASDWIWEMDENLRFTYLSERFYDLTGIAPRHVLGRTRWELGDGRFDRRSRKNGASIGKCWKNTCRFAISSIGPD